MKQMNWIIAALFGIVLLVGSCKSDDEPTPSNGGTCFVTGVKSDGDFSINNFEYNSDNLISKVLTFNYDSTAQTGRVELTYNGQLPKEMLLYNDATVEAKFTYHFDSNELPDTVYMQVPDETGTLVNFGYYLFVFEGDMLKEVTMNVPSSGNIYVMSKDQYTYSGDNVSTKAHYELSFETNDLELLTTYTFEYDTKRNPFHGVGLNFLVFVNDNTMTYFSQNNPTKVTAKDASGEVLSDKSYSVTMEYNDNDYPIKIIKEYVGDFSPETDILTYDCQ